jgi:hypothetical protein
MNGERNKMVSDAARKLAVLLGLASSIGLAPQSANAQGQPYSELRSQLLQEGWRPDASWGLKIGNGKPLYRFPEIVCGPEICLAKWHDPKGKEQGIHLIRGHGEEEHRVAE